MPPKKASKKSPKKLPKKAPKKAPKNAPKNAKRVKKRAKSKTPKVRTIKVDYLARVEGEGSLVVRAQGSKVVEVQLKIFEPPRFFEAILKGRSYQEVPDITARICGICPVAYQMSSVHALENAFGLRVNEELRLLRRLLYCGEWIESHVLHIYMLHAPDFLKYPDAIAMAKDYRSVVERGLRLKKIGNSLVNLLGGREIHPINVKVGGFYGFPPWEKFKALVPDLKWAFEAAIETVKWVAGFEFPELSVDFERVALRHESDYPFSEGRIVSDRGLDIVASDFEKHISEEHVKHSNALHATINGRGSYLVGPMARLALNHDRLSSQIQEIMRAIRFDPQERNPFKSIIVRAIEVAFALEEALRIITTLKGLPVASLPLNPLPAIGFAATEAPRGLLYHRYEIDQKGKIVSANIVPPTSQNQKSIEQDVARLVKSHFGLPDPELTHLCEQTVRNYDPCISCATHFLHLVRESV